MSAKELIQELRSEGALEKRGEFELDREKAREKMQRFQLPDPHAYVLEFVKAAHLLNATEISFEIDPDEMRVQFDGEPLNQSDLEDIYSAAFSKLQDDRKRALRHIGIGLTSARALNPGHVYITSGDTTGKGVRMVITDHGEDIEVGTELDAHTEIYLKEKFRFGHLVEFFQSIAGDLAEKTHLRDRCRFSTVPVKLNNRPISQGFSLDDAQNIVKIETPHENGILGLRDGRSFSVAHLVQNGVLIASHRVTPRLAPWEAVVQSTRLKTDLSESAFVEDLAFQDVMHNVIERAQDMAVRNRFKRLPLYQWSSHSLTARNLVRGSIQDVLRARNAGADLGWDTQFLKKIEAFPMWPTADKHDTGYRIGSEHFAPLAAFRGSDHLYYSTRRYASVELPGKSPVLLVTQRENTTLAQNVNIENLANYLGVQLRDVTNVFADREQWVINRERWRHQVWDTTLSKNSYPFRDTFEVDGIQVRMGLRVGPAVPSFIAWVKDRRLVRHTVLPSNSLPYIGVIVVGDFEPNSRFDGMKYSETYRQIALGVVRRLPALMATFASDKKGDWRAWEPEILMRFMHELSSGSVHRDFLRAFEMESQADAFFEREAAEPGPWRLFRTQPLNDADAFERQVEALGPLADAKIFEALDKRRISLRDLVPQLREQHAVYVVHDRYKNDGLRAKYERAKPAVGVAIWSNNRIDAVFYKLLGTRAMSARERIEFQAAKAQFLEKKPLDFVLPPQDYLAKATFEEDRMLIGLRAVAPDADGGSVDVQFRYEGRAVEARVLSCGPGYFWAVVDSKKLRPTNDFDEIIPSKNLTRVETLLVERAGQLAQGWMLEAGQTFEAVRALGPAEDLFWHFVVRYIEDDSHDVPEVVAGRSQNGKEWVLQELLDLVNHTKIHIVRDGYEILAELVPDGVDVITLHAAIPMTLFRADRIVDVSATDAQKTALERAENTFMQKRPHPLKITSSVHIWAKDAIAQPGVIGEVAMLADRGPFNSFRPMTLDLCFRKREVESREVFVPFGNFRAIVDSETFVLNARWGAIESGVPAVLPIVRDAAQNAMVKSCDEWDKTPRAYPDGDRHMMYAYLGLVIRNINSVQTVWPVLSARIRKTLLFPMTDGSWSSYDELNELFLKFGTVRFAHMDAATRFKAPNIVLLEDGFDDLPRVFNQLSWSNAADQPAIPELLTTPEKPTQSMPNTWRIADDDMVDDTADWRLLSSLREQLLEVRGTQSHLLGDAILENMQPVKRGGAGPVADVSVERILVDVEHPLAQHALERNHDSMALAMLGTSVYTAINVFYEEISDADEWSFQARYLAWASQR